MSKSFNTAQSSRCAFALVACILAGCESNNELKQLGLADEPDEFNKITVSIKDLCPVPGESLKDYMVHNHSVVFEEGRLRVATARDGISDYRKAKYGYNPLKRDSLSDGFSDALLYYSGIPNGSRPALRVRCRATVPDPFGPPGATRDVVNTLDTDSDGLKDCEEDLIRTRARGLPGQSTATSWDTDGDGISDYFALMNGLNPNDGYLANLSLNNDDCSDFLFGDMLEQNGPTEYGCTNAQKIKLGVDPSLKFEGKVKKAAYKYSKRTFLNDSDDECYDFTTSNIPIAYVSNGNLLKFYFTYDRSNFDTTTNTARVERIQKVLLISVPGSNDKEVLEYTYEALVNAN